MLLLKFRRPFRALSFAALALFTFDSVASAAGPVWQRATPFGGPLIALAEAPSATNTLYAVAQTGRLYRSRNNGASWERRGFLSQVQDLQVAPQNFSILYARTAERLLRSNNGGHTWKDLGPAAALAQDAFHFGILFAGNREGLFRSTDHGDSFVPWAFAGQPVAAVAVDPFHPSTLYAVTDRVGLSDPLVAWKSTNGGLTWAQAGVSASLSPIDILPPKIVFDPEQAGVLYIAFSTDEQLDPIFRTADGGATWTQLPTGLGLHDLIATTGGKLIGASFAGTSRSRDGGTTWNPPLPASVENPLLPRDHVARLAPSAVPEKVLAAGDAGFWFSSNAGGAWTSSNQGILAQGVGSVAVAPSGLPAVYATAESGVFRSLDEGTTWMRRYLTLPELAPLSIEAFHPEDPTTLYATGFDGVATFLARGTNGGRDWSFLPVPYGCGGDSICDVGMSVAGVDPHDPDAVLVAGYYFYHFGGSGEFLVRSNDGFATNKALAPLHRLGTVIVDADRAATLYGIACTGFHTSLDGGKTWRKTGRGLPARLCPEGISHPVMARDPQNPDKFYVGTLTQGVFASTDGGADFRAMNRNIETAPIRSLLIDPQDPAKLYVGIADRGVFRWNAQSARWTPIINGLPLQGFAGVVTLDPQNPNRLYAASPAQGVYRLDLAAAP